MKLQKPNSQFKQILFDLIIKTRGTTEEDRGWHAYRHYISKIRRILNVKHTDIPFVSDFGRKKKYRRHWITNSEKIKALKLYKSLFK